MSNIKSEKELQTIREGGKLLAGVLSRVVKAVRPGISSLELDTLAREYIAELGGDSRPSFLDYTPEGADRPYTAALCVSKNEEVVHGIPSKKKVLESGDCVGLDLGLLYKGTFTDMSVSLVVGEAKKEVRDLVFDTREALYAGIEIARPGNTIGDIGAAIGAIARRHDYGIIHELAGHGVGRAVHEPPFVPNYGKAGTGEKLRPGMVLALEPMFSLGTGDIEMLEDGYTCVTADGSVSAHFEHTIIITEGAPEIVTEVI